MSVEISNLIKESKPIVIGSSEITKTFKKVSKKLRGLLVLFIFFAVWEISPRIGIIDPMFLPTFSETITKLASLLLSGQLLVHLGASLQRSLIGYALAMLVGIPLGLFIGWYNKFEEYADLFLQLLRNTSTFALIPIFLLFFGLGETSKIATVLWAAIWPILINTISGVKSVEPIYIKAAKSLGLSDKELFRKVILPASFPSIVSGARNGAKSAIMVVIGAEMIGAKSGLGFFIQNAQFNFMIPEMFAGILLLSVLGVTLNYLLVWIEKKVTYWKGDVDNAING